MQDTALTDIKIILQTIRERWAMSFLLSCAVAGVVAYALISSPSKFEAEAGLLVERREEVVLDVTQVVDKEIEREFLDAFLTTHEDRLTTDTFLKRVTNSFSPKERAAILLPYESERQDYNQDQEHITATAVQKRIKKAIQIERSGSTMLLKILSSHRTPEVAKLIANRVATEYIASLSEMTNVSINSANQFLTRQSEALKSKILELEENLQNYRSENNLVALEDKKNIVIERLKTVSEALTRARLSQLEIQSFAKQIDSLFQSEELRQLSIAANSEELKETQRSLDAMQLERQKLSERYGNAHPTMINNADTLTALQQLLQDQARGVHTATMLDLEQAEDEVGRLQEELARVEKESLHLDELAAVYEAMDRELEATKGTYIGVLQRKQETDLSQQLQTSNVKLINPATLPLKPIWPNKTMIAAATFALACTIFIAFPIVMAFFDDRVKSYIDVTPDRSIPLLIEIPEVRKTEKVSREKIVINKLAPEVIESFRAMYSQIDRMHIHSACRRILITSSVPNEGKSFVACNLASSFAQHGKRTLLVDTDFRKPYLHSTFGLDNRHGILTWLKQATQQASSDPISNSSLGIRQIAPNLHLLRSGGMTNGLHEMLETTKLATLFDVLGESFDSLVLDTPPSGLFPDAEGLAVFADNLLFVSRFKETNRQLTQKVINRIRKTHSSHMCIVMNGMPTNKAGATYYSGHYYAASQYYAKA